jgi:hypothetical protein
MSAAKKLMKALPVEEEAPEEVEVEVEDESVEEESPEETVVTGEEEADANPAMLFMARIDAIEELLASLKKDARKLFKGKLPKRQSNKPKGETPTQVAEWNAFVAQTHALMQSEGWPEFTTKKGNTVAAGVEVDGKWLFVSEDGKSRAPAYKDAMAYARFLKDSAEDPEEKAAKAAEKAAEKEAEKARKKAEREEKRKAEKAERDAKKAAEKAEEKAKKDAEKKAADAAAAKAKELAIKAVSAKVAAAKPVMAAKQPSAKPAVAVAKPAAPVAKPAPKASPAASKPALVAAAAAAAAAAVKANGGAGKPAEEESVTAKKWVFKGKTYFKTPAGDCWIMKADKSQGPWAGRYDPETDSIDETAEEPSYESDEE